MRTDRLIAPFIHELEKQIIALQARVAELETRPALKYLGTWKEGKTYSAGTFITDAGGIWYCNASTTVRPGENADWSLAVKSGGHTATPRADESATSAARTNGHHPNQRMR